MRPACSLLLILVVALASPAVFAAEPAASVPADLHQQAAATSVVQHPYATGSWNAAGYGHTAAGGSLCHAYGNQGSVPCCGVDFGPLWAGYCLEKQRCFGMTGCHEECQACPPASRGCGRPSLLGRPLLPLRQRCHSPAACCDQPAAGCDGMTAAPAELPGEPPQLGEPPAVPPAPPETDADVAPAPPEAKQPAPPQLDAIEAPANRSTRRLWQQRSR